MQRRSWRIHGFMFLALPCLALISRTETNPPGERGRSFEAQAQAPPDIIAFLRRSCYDCHSNETRWPWYGRIAPLSTMMRRDVVKARAAVNFSEWPGDKKRLAAGSMLAMCSAVKSGNMPKRRYVLLHPGAKPSPAEVARVCEWTAAEARRLITEARR
jgi:hypothetical protein